jgi:hypothetical protein
MRVLQLVGQTYTVLLRRPALTTLLLEDLVRTFKQLPQAPVEGPPPGLISQPDNSEEAGREPQVAAVKGEPLSTGIALDGKALLLARFSLHILAAGLRAPETQEDVWGALWELHTSEGGPGAPEDTLTYKLRETYYKETFVPESLKSILGFGWAQRTSITFCHEFMAALIY